MRTEIIACKTIQRELTLAQQRCGTAYPVHWLEAGLHNVTAVLHDALQDALNTVHCDRVLMALGVCGNAVYGLQVRDYELIMPRVDDCITLLLGSRRSEDPEYAKGTYFLTKGWLEGERNIWVEYNYALKKYGPELGRAINRLTYGKYCRLGVIDTGACDMAEILPETEKIAAEIGLEHRIIPAGIEHICRLLTGPWDPEDYAVFAPGTEVSLVIQNVSLQT